MSSITTRADIQNAWWIRLLTHDYCPSANRYVYWLKEPIGWFVLAMVASVLVGAYLSPIGWSLAAGLACVVAIGLVFPWISVRVVRCTIDSEVNEFHEEDTGYVQLTVCNRSPLPLYGLVIRGFVVQPASASHLGLSEETTCERSESQGPTGDFGLAGVPWMSRASFRLPITPQFRGRYPQTNPEVTCSFPFGIWTAKRPLHQVHPIVVHPQTLGLCGLMDHQGRIAGQTGYGERTGGHGDFLGVRAFRRGDAIRSIHWQHTARLDSLVVCERGSPERVEWVIRLDPLASPGSLRQVRENLKWRVRLAASLATLMTQQNIDCRLEILGESDWVKDSPQKLNKVDRKTLPSVFDRLTDVPLNGISLSNKETAAVCPEKVCNGSGLIVIEPAKSHECFQQHKRAEYCFALRVNMPGNHTRSVDCTKTVLIDVNQDVTGQVNDWMRRFEYGTHVA